MSTEARILVIGGGPAGACCALRLRQLGASVDVAEKEQFPRAKVCGCCIGGAGLGALESIGLQDQIVRVGVPIRWWRCSVGSHLATLPLPTGVSISREALDMELLRSASSAGANVRHQCRAVIADCDDRGVTVRLEQGDQKNRRVYDCVVVAAGLNAAGLATYLPWIEPPSGPFGVSFTSQANQECETGVIYMACDDDGYVGVVRLENGRVDVAAALKSGSAASIGSPVERVHQILSRSVFPDWSINDCSRAADDAATAPTPSRRKRAYVGHWRRRRVR